MTEQQRQYSLVAVSIYIPNTVQEGSLFSTPSLAFIVFILFDEGRPDWCEVIPYCSFDLTSLKVMLSIFLYASWPSVCLLWRNVSLGLLPTCSSQVASALSLNSRVPFSLSLSPSLPLVNTHTQAFCAMCLLLGMQARHSGVLSLPSHLPPLLP